jgi:hypothetical protein
MGAFYKDARLKVDWAKEHSANVDAAVYALEETHIAAIEHHPNGGQRLKHEIPNLQPSLDRISLMVGDALHNTRAALDFAWYKTIERCLPDKLGSWTKFPVKETRDSVEGTLRGIKVDTRCPALFDLIMFKIKPYDGAFNPTAWVLHNLDISDKHLLLLGLSPLGHIRGIVVLEADGQMYRGDSMESKGVEGRYSIDFEPGIKIQQKGRLSVTVTLQEAGVFNHLSVQSLLGEFRNYTLTVIELLENI